jgi:hypothetical protein
MLTTLHFHSDIAASKNEVSDRVGDRILQFPSRPSSLCDVACNHSTGDLMRGTDIGQRRTAHKLAASVIGHHLYAGRTMFPKFWQLRQNHIEHYYVNVKRVQLTEVVCSKSANALCFVGMLDQAAMRLFISSGKPRKPPGDGRD